ncbi:MAG: peptidylprolyl isomerase [Pseudomonadota bacterium]
MTDTPYARLCRATAIAAGLFALAFAPLPAIAQTDDGGDGQAPAEQAEPAPEADAPAAGEDAGDAAAAEAEDAGEEAAEAPAVPAPPVAAGDTVASVDGTALELGDLLVLRQNLPAQYQQLPDEILIRGLIEQLIDQELLATAAIAAGLEATPSTAYNLASVRRATLAEAYLRDQLTARVTEDAVREAYDAEIATAEPVREVRASHILVDEEAKAADLRAQLDRGADFAELAREHGTDGTAARGGDLNFFAFEEMVPEFAEAAFATEIGSVSGPIQTQFGWHVILVTDERERPLPAFEEVAPQIADSLRRQVQRDVIEELRAAAAVEIVEPGVPPAAIRDDALLAAPSE